MELHTLGVDRTYRQRDVVAVAEVVTGWGIDTGADGTLMFRFHADRYIGSDQKFLGYVLRRESTMVLVMTEFGRTVAENGSNGTDHGHGGGMFLLGGGVKGGQVHGEFRGLKPADLYQGRDLPVTTDFRDVFAEVLRGVFDFKAPRGFFPDYRPKRLKLF